MIMHACECVRTGVGGMTDILQPLHSKSSLASVVGGSVLSDLSFDVACCCRSISNVPQLSLSNYKLNQLSNSAPNKTLLKAIIYFGRTGTSLQRHRWRRKKNPPTHILQISGKVELVLIPTAFLRKLRGHRPQCNLHAYRGEKKNRNKRGNSGGKQAGEGGQPAREESAR